MSKRQAAFERWAIGAYFMGALGHRTELRVRRRGLLLPISALWAGVAGAQLLRTVICYREWHYTFDVPFVRFHRLYDLTYGHELAYGVLLIWISLLGLGVWANDGAVRPGESDRGAIVGAVVAAVTLPTYLESAPTLLAAVGAIGVSNVVLVLTRGRPLALPKQRGRALRKPGPHPAIEDIP